jgi:phospho-N-acetylmuramoyl-pentapeptide-transferase
MIGFGLIGLIDDFLKIKGKNTKGLHPKLKLALQILLAFIFMYVSEKIFMENNNIIIPFTKQVIGLSVLSIPIMVFIIVGTDNAVNFTDGIDGLCSVVTIIVAIFFIIVSIRFEKLEIAILSAALIGVLSSFLIFNKHPASIFMGDVGSLFLGSFVGIIAYMLKIQLLIPIFGFVYFMEIMSVIIQVTYFKLTKGKRIFKMAPIHHHFEKSGWSEKKVFTVFTAVSVIFALLSLLGVAGRYGA